MQSYRINAVHELRAARIAALEEIAKEKPIYFSGVDEEFVRNQALLSDAKRNYKGAISALCALASKDASFLFVLDDTGKIGREGTHLEKEHAKLAGRQERIAVTAKRIEDILTDVGFEKQTLTPSEESSIDYVIYTCRRDDHVDVLADRDLRTKKMGVRLYRIPENEFAEWYGALRAEREHALDALMKFDASMPFMMGAITCGATQIGIAWYAASFGPFIVIGLNVLTVGLAVAGHFIGSQTNYLDRTLVAKGKKALLHLTRQEEVVPQYRVVVEQEDATTDDAIEHEHNEVNQPSAHQHKPLI